ncbi:hypothetical protein ACGFZP_03450 [Kitasatospora sp. NPDC048239]|uniref:hypothetical protein n=1 Tax=Kitasatospora sp. NPDC048239 TaxID=3364046 RepID=UPI00371500D7
MHRALRRLAVLAAAGTLLAPAAFATSASASPGRTESAATTRAGGVYISPWGSAHLALSEETSKWIAEENVTVTAIEPFRMDEDGKGVEMPIGSTAGDHLDAQGRIFYPGGLKLTHPGSGHTFTLIPTYIRVMPTPLWSSGLQVDGTEVSPEFPVGDTSYGEVIASGRPTFTGFKLDKLPFHVTQDASDLISQYTNRPGPKAGSVLGTLTPRFDYVPAG